MHNKIYSMLGLANKAGKLLKGSDTCERALKTGKVNLVVLSTDASEGTAKKFKDMCSYRDIEIRFFGDRYRLGKITGKEERVVVAVCDKGFAGTIIDLIDQSLINGGETNG